jgi:iron complex outermembrane receptor protein
MKNLAAATVIAGMGWAPLTTPAQTVPDTTPPPADQAAAPPPASIEEIVVTARRTAENAQTVPVAISAMGAEDLQREQINSVQDLQGRVPSMNISPQGTQRNVETPTIRGQGATYSASPGVVIYFAEVPLPADSVGQGQGGPGKFFDLADVQVLKGSQGTLFGRNTTGGALLLEPRKPDNGFSGLVKVEGTTYSGQNYEGVLNVPLVDDKLLLRAAGKFLDRGGYTHDVVTGKDYDNKHFWTARLGLTWKPTDSINNYFLGYYTSSQDNGTGTVLNAINSAGFNAAILAGIGLSPLPIIPPQLQPGCLYFDLQASSTNCGQDIVAAQQARDIRHVQLSADPMDMVRTGAAIDNLGIDLNDKLTLRNIASYSSYKHNFRWDADGSRAPLNDNHNPDGTHTSDLAIYTDELQLQGKALDDRLKFTSGFYLEHGRPQGAQENYVTAIFNPVYQTFTLKHTSYGPYAQGTYDLGGISDALDTVRLTVGARYTVDRISGNGLVSVGSPTGTSTTIATGALHDAAPTWTVGLDDMLGDTLVYGKVSRGYKAGGFSGIAVNPAHFTFGPEFVTNYEVGQKSDFHLGQTPARVNTAVYYTNYRDMQRTGVDSYVPPNAAPGTMPEFGGATFNVGNAAIAGVELDATVQPATGLSLVAGYSFTYTQYKRYELLSSNLTPAADCTGQVIPRGQMQHLQCIPFAFAPRNQYSVSGRYALPLDPAIGKVEGALTWAWTGGQYTSNTSVPSTEPDAWLSPYGLLNGSLSWGHIYGALFDIQLYGTNLLNKQYRISNSSVWNTLYFQSSIWGEPRIIGLQMSYAWGGG